MSSAWGRLMRTAARAACMAAALAVGAPAWADEVVMSEGRLEGPVTFKASGVRVGDRQVKWESVRTLRANEGVRVYGQPNLVRLRNGEVWAVEVVSLLDGVLRVRSPLIGERSLPVGQVAQVVLNRQARGGGDAEEAQGEAPAIGEGGGGVLVTSTGEALPGELMWISEEEVAVESLLGVMRMPRESTASYAFAAPGGASSAAQGDGSGGDLVTLLGGARLTGSLQGRDGGVTLSHGALGELAIPGERIRTIRRATPGAVLLAALKPARVEGRPLFSFARLPDLPTPDAPTLRLWSGGSVAYTLPHAGRLEATVAAVEGARGRSMLQVLSGGKVVATKVVDAGAAAQWLSVDLPSADVTLEAVFGDVISIPSGVELIEPRLISK